MGAGSNIKSFEGGSVNIIEKLIICIVVFTSAILMTIGGIYKDIIIMLLGIWCILMAIICPLILIAKDIRRVIKVAFTEEDSK